MSIHRPRSSSPPAALSTNQLGSLVVISGATLVAGAQDHAAERSVHIAVTRYLKHITTGGRASRQLDR